MAEFIMKDIVKKRNISDKFCIASSATSTEEIGNAVHHGTRKKLNEFGITTEGKFSIQFTKNDYKNYDYIICMDSNNVRNLIRIIGDDSENKVKRLLDFTSRPGDIADPWYTGDFNLTYEDVKIGCEALLNLLHK